MNEWPEGLFINVTVFPPQTFRNYRKPSGFCPESHLKGNPFFCFEVVRMGLGTIVKNGIVYGTLTVGALYALASCEPKTYNRTELNRTADKGLECVQKGIRITEYGLDTLDKKIEERREELRGERK
jgi:hypothetical protein